MNTKKTFAIGGACIVLVGGAGALTMTIANMGDSTVIPGSLIQADGSHLGTVTAPLSPDQRSSARFPVQSLVGADGVVRDVYSTDRLSVKTEGGSKTYEAGKDRTFWVISTDPEGSTDLGVKVGNGDAADLPRSGGTTVLVTGKDTPVSIVDRASGTPLVPDLRTFIADYLAKATGATATQTSQAKAVQPSSLSAATPVDAARGFVTAVNAGDAATACGYLSPAAIADIAGNAGSCAAGGLSAALSWKNYVDESWLFNTQASGWTYDSNGYAEKAKGQGTVAKYDYVTVHSGTHSLGFTVVPTRDGNGWQVDTLAYQGGK